MASRFGILLDILMEAFRNPVSETDYYTIVQVLQDYTEARSDTIQEQEELAKRGLPINYHPCDHMERIRFGMVFGNNRNSRIKDLVTKLKNDIHP